MTGTSPDEPWKAAQFETLLRDLLTQADSDTATFAEAGYTSSLYGLRLTLPAGAVIYLQIVTARPPNERGGRQGTPPPHQRAAALPTKGKTALTAVERHLISVLTARQDPYIRWAEPFSKLSAAIPYGLRVTFHCGAVVCCYVVRAIPAGSSSPRGGHFPSLRHI